jgi:methionyl-tRNA formyltransferase
MTTPLDIAFAGTPAFAARHLLQLLAGPHNVVAALTQPDRPSGRGKRLQPSPVKATAMEAGVPVWQPESLRQPHSAAELMTIRADVLIVVAYGLILPPEILAIPQLGCINVHASLLPRWRGAAPVQRAIEAGDSETGVCIMLMEPGLDTGPVLLSRILTIEPHHTGGTLMTELAEIGAETLGECLNDYEHLLQQAKPQDDAQASYAKKIEKHECAIDWSADATDIARRVRAFHPAPGCFTFLGSDRVKLRGATAGNHDHSVAVGEIISADEAGLCVACGTGTLTISEAQMPGAKPQPVAALINGHRERLRPGNRFLLTPVAP